MSTQQISFSDIVAFFSLIIATIALIHSIKTNYKTEKAQKEILEVQIANEKNKKLQDVINKYMELTQSGRDTGLSALLSAGVANLSSDEEIREVCRQISNRHPKQPPLNEENQEMLKQKDLFKFFQLMRADGGFGKSSVEDLIARL